jgi:hypothetical protein
MYTRQQEDYWIRTEEFRIPGRVLNKVPAIEAETTKPTKEMTPLRISKHLYYQTS